jgi:hypothetical protein
MRSVVVSTLAVTLMACSSDAGPNQVSKSRELSVDPITTTAHQPRAMSDQEMRLIDELEKMFPGPRGADLRRRLTDQRVVSIRIPAHPKAQELLDQLTRLRKAAADSVAQFRVAQPHARMVTIGMPIVWDNDSVKAIAIIENDASKSETVLVPSGATGDNVGVGLKALSKLRAMDKNPNTRLRLAVKGVEVPPNWKRDGMSDLATAMLHDLRNSRVTRLSSGERGRVTTIPVMFPTDSQPR